MGDVCAEVAPFLTEAQSLLCIDKLMETMIEYRRNNDVEKMDHICIGACLRTGNDYSGSSGKYKPVGFLDF